MDNVTKKALLQQLRGFKLISIYEISNRGLPIPALIALKIRNPDKKLTSDVKTALDRLNNINTFNYAGKMPDLDLLYSYGLISHIVKCFSFTRVSGRNKKVLRRNGTNSVALLFDASIEHAPPIEINNILFSATPPFIYGPHRKRTRRARQLSTIGIFSSDELVFIDSLLEKELEKNRYLSFEIRTMTSRYNKLIYSELKTFLLILTEKYKYNFALATPEDYDEYINDRDSNIADKYKFSTFDTATINVYHPRDVIPFFNDKYSSIAVEIVFSHSNMLAEPRLLNTMYKRMFLFSKHPENLIEIDGENIEYFFPKKGVIRVVEKEIREIINNNLPALNKISLYNNN